jgi:hypothetical protein
VRIRSAFPAGRRRPGARALGSGQGVRLGMVGRPRLDGEDGELLPRAPSTLTVSDTLTRSSLPRSGFTGKQADRVQVPATR